MHALTAVVLASVAFIAVADALHCNATYTWYSWAANSNGDDPCQLVSGLYTSCAPKANPLPPILYTPSRMNFYPGPNSSVQNSCMCSYVMYNLMSACSDCQVGLSAPAAWPAYKDWAQLCRAGNTGAIYPDALPNSFLNSIPKWARVATSASSEYRWSYSLSRVGAAGLLPHAHILAARSLPCPLQPSPALPIGTAFAGLVVGVLFASLAFLFHRRRRARVIPTPTRYHTAPDNTPLHPLVPRPAHSHGTNFLRRMLETYHENDPNRIDPFDISAAGALGSFPPHPAVYSQPRGHGFPPALSIQSPSRGPSRQPSASSLAPITFAPHPSLRHSRSHSHTKPGSRPQTVASQFTSSGPAAPGPSTVPLQNISPSESPSPLPPADRHLPVPEEPPTYWPDPPVYRRKT